MQLQWVIVDFDDTRTRVYAAFGRWTLTLSNRIFEDLDAVLSRSDAVLRTNRM